MRSLHKLIKGQCSYLKVVGYLCILCILRRDLVFAGGGFMRRIEKQVNNYLPRESHGPQSIAIRRVVATTDERHHGK
jgi:hypothetical protein